MVNVIFPRRLGNKLRALKAQATDKSRIKPSKTRTLVKNEKGRLAVEIAILGTALYGHTIVVTLDVLFFDNH